ncbi:hypothetical protein V2G26_003313 [Clonostachys chloroleuca]
MKWPPAHLHESWRGFLAFLKQANVSDPWSDGLVVGFRAERSCHCIPRCMNEALILKCYHETAASTQLCTIKHTCKAGTWVVCFVDLAWVHDRNYEAPPGPGLGHHLRPPT